MGFPGLPRPDGEYKPPTGLLKWAADHPGFVLVLVFVLVILGIMSVGVLGVWIGGD